jgi:hypothetical protein
MSTRCVDLIIQMLSAQIIKPVSKQHDRTTKHNGPTKHLDMMGGQSHDVSQTQTTNATSEQRTL